MVEPLEPSSAGLLRLRGAAAVVGCSARELWLAYFALGGDGSCAAVTSWLHGEADRDRTDNCILSVAVHEALLDVGLDPPPREGSASRGQRCARPNDQRAQGTPPS